MAPEALVVLPELGLTADEIAALRRQGFVSRERRGHGHVRYKLRFRHGGKQHVRYLGQDPQVADRVRQELASLQAATRLDRHLGRLLHEVTPLLRSVKTRLEPVLQDAGYRFHGLSIRRKQSMPAASANEGA
jgi:hypothetical protein